MSGGARIFARTGVLFLGCISLSFAEVAREFGSWLPPAQKFAVRASEVFPRVTGRDEDGVVRTNGPAAGEPALVFVVSPFCSVCDQEAPNVRSLLEVVFPVDATALPVDVLFVSMGPVDLGREFLAQHGLRGRLLAVNGTSPSGPEEARSAELLASTPQAYLVAADGRVVLKAGVLSHEDAQEWTKALWHELESK